MPIQVGTNPTQNLAVSEPSLLDQVIGLLPLLFIFVIVIVAIVLFIRWLNDRKESRKDIYTNDYRKTIEQCKISKNTKWLRQVLNMPLWLASKGVPVYLNYPPITYSKEMSQLTKSNNMDRFTIQAGESYRLGSYAGHCITTDGTFNLLVKSAHDKVMFIFPKLIVIKLRLKHIQKIIDPKNMKETKTLDVPPDSFTLSNDMIQINAFGLEKINNYFYAVNGTADGYIVDTKSYAYQDHIDIATQRQVMDLGRNMASLSEELARGNPLVQFLKRTDTSLNNE